MFPRQPQPPQPYIPDYSEQFKTLTDHVKELSDTIRLQIRKEALKGPPVVTDIATLSAAATTVDMHEYKYFGIIVAANTTVHVEQNNLHYDVTLSAGFNRVTVFDGANLTTDSATPCVLVKSAHLFY